MYVIVSPIIDMCIIVQYMHSALATPSSRYIRYGVRVNPVIDSSILVCSRILVFVNLYSVSVASSVVKYKGANSLKCNPSTLASGMMYTFLQLMNSIV